MTKSKDRVFPKVYTYLVIFSHFRSLSVRKSAFVNISWLGSEKSVNKIAKVSSRCLHYFSAAILEVFQHGGSILKSKILCGTFRRISQLWDNAHTLNLENCLYLSSTISQFLDFFHCMVFDFIFLLRSNAHIL